MALKEGGHLSGGGVISNLLGRYRGVGKGGREKQFMKRRAKVPRKNKTQQGIENTWWGDFRRSA